VLSSTYQSTDSPLLSTFYKPLFKHLISVLGEPWRMGGLWALARVALAMHGQLLAYFFQREGLSS
jgi:hypothetical protein